MAPPVTAGVTAERITHRNWTDEWVTVRCGACGREDDWPHPELGCACGTVLRVPVQPVGTEPGASGAGGGGRGAGAARPAEGRGQAPAAAGDPIPTPQAPTPTRASTPTPAPQTPSSPAASSASSASSSPSPSPSPSPPPSGSPSPASGRGVGSTSGTPSGTPSGTDPRGQGAAPRDPGVPGLTPPTAAGETFGARTEGAPVHPGASGAGGPAGPRAFESGSEWFGTGPTGQDDGAPGGQDVPPGARTHRTFAERYPAHIPLPPTAPRPEPVRGAFRPVTIRTARDAVAAAAGYLRWLGFRDVVQPEDHPTSGVDLRAPGLVAQVDPSTRPAGLRAVECLWLNGLSTPSTSVSVFFSLAGYTPEARQRAAEIGLPLFVLDLTGTPQPVNLAADELASGGA
ncbi:hypothetical protein ACWFR1_00550 [Streptomyces sp. NPDC055103]